MKAKIDRLFLNYLNEKLELVLNNDAGRTVSTKLSFIPYTQYEFCSDYVDGYAVVQKDDLYNFIDEKGNLISNRWFNDEYDFDGSGLAMVYDDKIGWNFIDIKGRIISTQWFGDVEAYNGNYAKVELAGKYSLLKRNGKRIRKDWYEYIGDYHEDYVLVRKDDKYNYLDKDGNYISDIWYDDANDFVNGYAIVSDGNTIFHIDKNGDRVKTPYDFNYLGDFSEDGIAAVELTEDKNGYKCNYITRDGNLLVNECFDRLNSFCGGYGLVEKDGKYGFIDVNGKLLKNKWFDEVSDFSDGYALVKENYKYNYIDQNGNYLIKHGLDGEIYPESFEDGCAIVEYSEQGYTVLINRYGNRAMDRAYNSIEHFSDNLWLLYDGQKYELINRDGKYITKEPYDSIELTDDNIILVKLDNKYNILDKQKGLISANRWFTKIEEWDEKYFVVYDDNNKQNLMDKDGNIILKDWCDEIISGDKWIKIKINGHVNYVDHDGNYAYDQDLKDYKLSKKLLGKGYKCTFGSDSFSIKYNPLRIYGIGYVLCEDAFGTLYLFNRRTNTYEEIADKYKVMYDDSFLFYNNHLYFFYNNEKFDITAFYHKFLQGKTTVNIADYIEILSREDFQLFERNRINKILEEEKARNKQIHEEQELIKQQNEIQAAKDSREARREALKRERIDILNSISELLSKYNKVNQELQTDELEEAPRVLSDDIFVQVGDHLEILDFIKANLSSIDLRKMSFKNVDVSGIDFRRCNIDFSPQVVYNKDLRGCDFTGINLSPVMNFMGVDIRGAKFSIDNDPTTKDYLPYFKGAIYDETTTYNGTPLTELIGPCKELENKSLR